MENTSSSSATLFLNGRILEKAGRGLHAQATFAEAMFIQDGCIKYVGTQTPSVISEYRSVATSVHDLKGRMVLPGFIDGHMHLLMLGQSLRKLDLQHCKSLEDIRAVVKSYAANNTDIPRILCKGWMHSMTDGKALASMLNDLDPRPIFIDSKDLHSTWCNDAALEELGIADTPNPPGGRIHRDETGAPSGLLDEAAVLTIVWPHQARMASVRERIDSIRGAVDVYHATGYTGMVEMAMDEAAWEALVTLYSEEPDLAMRITAYWLIKPSLDETNRLAQVDRAIELHAQFNDKTSPNLRIAGIKIICDGIVDACTAFLSEPYSNSTDSSTPLWTQEQLAPVVSKAEKAGLQIALHAIGDAAIKVAVDVLEKHCSPGGRHRIEHLELASEADAKRLGQLGITSSIQPVHADPAILRAWPRLIGHERCGRAFAFREFADGGSLLALGSDSPTAPWEPFGNVYVACSRRSGREPESEEIVNEKFRLGLCEATAAATAGAAESVFADERVGRLEPGLRADFVVFEMDWDVGSLLKAEAKETWFDGKRVWNAQQ